METPIGKAAGEEDTGASLELANRDPDFYDGRWVAREGSWAAELEIENRAFRLRVECGQMIMAETSGTMDRSGRIHAILAPGLWYKVVASGTLNRLNLSSRHSDCRRADLRFERAG